MLIVSQVIRGMCWFKGIEISYYNIMQTKEDVFFELITSWKKTRDLAVKAQCTEAIRVADEMFPYLSPVVCNEEKL